MHDEKVADHSPPRVDKGSPHIRTRIHRRERLFVREELLDVRGEIDRLRLPDHPFACGIRDVVFEHGGRSPGGPVGEGPHTFASPVGAFRHQGILHPQALGQRTDKSGEELVSAVACDLLLYLTHELAGHPPVAYVARYDDDSVRITVCIPDDAPLRFDVPDSAVPVNQPVFQTLSDPCGHGLTKHVPYFFPVVRMYVHERARPFQRVGLIEEIRVRRVVVDAPPFEIEDSDQVTRALDGASEYVFSFGN